MDQQDPGLLSPESSSAVPRLNTDKLVAIVGLPRSGTTVVTAILSVHSEVASLYEPWNANKATVKASDPMGFDAFVQTFVTRKMQAKSVLVVKETATDPDYITRVGELLETAPASMTRELIIPLRNPFHVFLSEVQARREWWGATDLRVGPETFDLWARRTLQGLRLLAKMARNHDALLLSYERFSADRAMVDELTRAIKLTPEPDQLEFERHLNQSAVRGDLNVAQSPRSLTASSVEHRAHEFETARSLVESSAEFAAISRVAELLEEFPALSRAREHGALIDRLSTIGL